MKKIQFISLLNILCMTLCLLVSSCSPWESDLENVYKAAQKGNKDAMFAIVRHYQNFKDVIPLDSFKHYQNILIANGDHKVLTDACLNELDEYLEAHPQKNGNESDSQKDAIILKWYHIGIQNGDIDSYYDLGNYYDVRYANYRHPQDSLKAIDLYQKAWENWHEGERIFRDRQAGIIPLVKGGIAYGWHVYKKTEDKSFIPRLFNAGLFFSEYTMGGLLKLLFTSQWWKVLIAIFLLVFTMSIPLIILKRLYSASSIQRNSMSLGQMLGFWNLMLIFIAYCNDNPNWVNNVGALWFPEASYGLQPYLCITPNLFLLFLLLGNMTGTAWEYIKTGKGVGTALTAVCSIGLVFTINYLIAGIAGLFYLFISILIILVKSVVGGVPEIAGAAINSTIPDFPKTYIPPKQCFTCHHYDPKNEYCKYYENDTNIQAGEDCPCYVPK